MPSKKERKGLMQEKVDVQIGKRGVTDQIIEYIRERLKAAPFLKVKILRSALGEGTTAKQVATDVAGKVHAKLADVRGNMFVLSH
jgi:RNA-binding protein YhbY